MHGEIAATRDGKILGLQVDVLADHGAFNGTAQPTKFPAGFFHIFTGCYDLQAAHCKVTGVYTNKAPGGVAYACSFRITEAVYLVERMVDVLAAELGMDPAELRMKNLLRPEQFPYTTQTGWEYDSGDYPRALQLALDIAGYDELRARAGREARARRADGHRHLASSPRASAPGPRKHMDILGLGMADGCELRVHPTGKARAAAVGADARARATRRRSRRSSPQELGIPPEDIEVIHGDTDNTPFGLGTYGSRSTPVSGAAAAVVARRVRDKAQDHRRRRARVLARRPRVGARPLVRSRATRSRARRSRRSPCSRTAPSSCPRASRATSTRPCVYNPPNLTYPFGAYICVVDVDPGTGEVKVRRFIAVDDCGPRINPMIVEGQVHGGLADGIGMALMQVDRVRRGRQLPGRLVHGLPAADLDGVPVAGSWARPSRRRRTTRSGCKGVGESATVGSPPAVVNAVIDALAPFGVRHADMPLTPAQVWLAMQGRPVRTDLAMT